MKDLPGPSDMFEELADKVIGHMERGAVTSFRSALDEMIDFHRFMIDAHETCDTDGNSFNYAEIGYYLPMYNDWLQQYRRVFDKASRLISVDRDFIRILVGVPKRLVCSAQTGSSVAVNAALLDVMLIAVYRLEDWFTRQRTYEQKNGNLVSVIAGSDSRVYPEMVRKLVGDWEDALRAVKYIYDWKRGDRDIDPAEHWDRYVTSWRFLQSHQQNSAEMLAAAVWNEDEVAAELYQEMLARWFYPLRIYLPDDHFLNETHFNPDFFGKNWDEMLEVIPVVFPHPALRPPIPSQIFSISIQNALYDTIVVTCAVMIGWFVNRRQNSDIAVRTVKSLIDAPAGDALGRREKVSLDFAALFFSVMRILAVGGRFSDKGYGASLDEIIRKLDGRSEREIVPGRVFRPTTHHERRDVMLPLLSFLLWKMPESDNARSVQRVLSISENENFFSQSYEVLRDYIDSLEDLKNFLKDQYAEHVLQAVMALNPEIPVEERKVHLNGIFNSIIETLERQREKRLDELSVDREKLESFRSDIEKVLRDDNGGLDVLSNIAVVVEKVDQTPIYFAVGGIEKGYLTEPEMAEKPVNIDEVVTRQTEDFIFHRVFSVLLKRERKTISVDGENAFIEALEEYGDRIARTGSQPVLLVPDWNDPPWIERWFGWAEEVPRSLTIRRKLGVKTHLYIGTVNDIDIYRSPIPSEQSLLFRSDILAAIKYAPDDDGKIVDVEFTALRDNSDGILKCRVRMQLDWRDDEIIELLYRP